MLDRRPEPDAVLGAAAPARRGVRLPGPLRLALLVIEILAITAIAFALFVLTFTGYLTVPALVLAAATVLIAAVQLGRRLWRRARGANAP